MALDEKTDRADFLVGDGGCLTTEANKLKAGGGSSFFLDAVDSFCSLGWCCFGKSCAVGVATVSSSDFISSFVSVVMFSMGVVVAVGECGETTAGSSNCSSSASSDR